MIAQGSMLANKMRPWAQLATVLNLGLTGTWLRPAFLMEPLQLELLQNLRGCVSLLQSNCEKMKSCLDTMINALQSVDQSLTLIVQEDLEPVEPPAKRPRVSAVEENAPNLTAETAESAAEPLVIPEWMYIWSMDVEHLAFWTPLLEWFLSEGHSLQAVATVWNVKRKIDVSGYPFVSVERHRRT